MNQDAFLRHDEREKGSSEPFIQVLEAVNGLVEQVAQFARCDDQDLLASLDTAIANIQVSDLPVQQATLEIQVRSVSSTRSVEITITMTVQTYAALRDLLMRLLQRICAGERGGSLTDGEAHASFAVVFDTLL